MKRVVKVIVQLWFSFAILSGSTLSAQALIEIPNYPNRYDSGSSRDSDKSENEAYSRRQQQKSVMYECIQTCSGTGCRYLDGSVRQQCYASEERCKANCR